MNHDEMMEMCQLYDDYTVKDLKKMAKERNIKGYSKLRRFDLIELIHLKKSTPEIPYRTKCFYSELIRAKKCKNYSGKSKSQLMKYARTCEPQDMVGGNAFINNVYKKVGDISKKDVAKMVAIMVPIILASGLGYASNRDGVDPFTLPESNIQYGGGGFLISKQPQISPDDALKRLKAIAILEKRGLIGKYWFPGWSKQKQKLKVHNGKYFYTKRARGEWLDFGEVMRFKLTKRL